jgi:hypothetical protein
MAKTAVCSVPVGWWSSVLCVSYRAVGVAALAAPNEHCWHAYCWQRCRPVYILIGRTHNAPFSLSVGSARGASCSYCAPVAACVRVCVCVCVCVQQQPGTAHVLCASGHLDYCALASHLTALKPRVRVSSLTFPHCRHCMFGWPNVCTHYKQCMRQSCILALLRSPDRSPVVLGYMCFLECF